MALPPGARPTILLISDNAELPMRLQDAFSSLGLHPVSIVVMPAFRTGTEFAAILERGGDNYVEGPIDPDEVVTRVRGVLQRGDAGRRLAEVVRIGSLCIAPGSRQARVEGVVVDLTSIEYDILEYLVREAGRVVPRGELLGATVRRTPTRERSLDVHISHLRRKLREYGFRIVTVRGIGYMMAAPEADGGR